MQTSSEQKILVTGGAGFIGSRIAESFSPENEVVVLDNLSSGSSRNVPEAATFIEADVRNADAVSAAATDADVIFHEAALVSVTASVDDPKTSHAINVDGTINVLEAARQQDARVVLASSAAIYGPPETVPIAEDHPKQPGSPYGLDKLALDQYAQIYNDLYGLETVPLRYFNVYGPGQTGGDYAGVISVFVEQALAGDDITVHGDGAQTRDFVFIDDIVAANRRASATAAVGEPFNIGTGESITIRELAELIQSVTDSSSDIVHTAGRAADIKQSRADISKATDQLEYTPTTSIEDGIERTVEWYKSRQISQI